VYRKPSAPPKNVPMYPPNVAKLSDTVPCVFHFSHFLSGSLTVEVSPHIANIELIKGLPTSSISIFLPTVSDPERK